MRPEKGIYVAVKFSDQTVLDLKKYQEENEIPNPLDQDEFHCTIISSRFPIEWEPDEDLNVKVKPKKIEVWNTRSGNNCLVLTIKSDYLDDQFDKAMELGATHDFDGFNPHVTLSYDVGDFDASELKLPTFPIVITKEYKEELRDH